MTACAYCRTRGAVNRDHVVPRQLARKYRENRRAATRPRIPDELLGTVPCCFDCNIRKGTRRLVPPSWENKLDTLNEFFGGSPFRVWDGNPMSLSYRTVHL